MNTIEQPTSASAPPPNDPYHIGYRDEVETLPDGSRKLTRIPLTLEDFLHPQDGDHFVQGVQHDRICSYLAWVFRARVAKVPGAAVIADVGVFWDDPEFKHNSPDISVLFDVEDEKLDVGSFDVATQGTRPRLVVEVTSPSTRSVDLGDKFDIFHAVGIQYYAIIDRENYEDPWTLAGYERTSRKYRSLPLDERGRLWLEAVGVWLAVEGDEVICYDASGKRLGDYVQVSEYADQEHERAEKEQQRAEKALKRAEKEQQRAEMEREQAAKERERADKQRERAESAEARTRELEAELARFRRPTSPG